MIITTTRLLLKKYAPQWVLLTSGIIMIALAAILGITPINVEKSSGSSFFDIFEMVEGRFLTSIVKLGFMIMAIGGYVTLMNKIKATDAMVYIVTKPLSFLKKSPYLASVLFIPLGMLLYLPISSAAGLGLLLVSTLYPILTGLGVSRPTAITVISAATIFDMGPSSANTIRAAELLEMDSVEYFMRSQFPLVLITTLVVMIAYYFSNRWYDRRETAKGVKIYNETAGSPQKPDVPLFFAFLPFMPLILLILLSNYIGLSDIHISTAAGIFLCVLITALILIIQRRSLRAAFDELSSFWTGMGAVFSSVVTLIITAEIFAAGLNSLHFIDLLVDGTSSVGLGSVSIMILMTATVFVSAIMMGSGNAAFFSFGPLIPGISAMFGVPAIDILLPVQMCAGMGRASSPIAAVNVVISGAAGISPMTIAKRNLIPMLSGAATLIIAHCIIN